MKENALYKAREWLSDLIKARNIIKEKCLRTKEIEVFLEDTKYVEKDEEIMVV